MEASAVPGAAPSGAWGAASPRLLRLCSDDRLVGLVRAGYPAAFEAVYNRHHRAIHAFCRHLLGSAEEAEDVVQHTFLAAYNGLADSEREITLRPWLFTVARNRCLSLLRARREYPSDELAEPVTDGLAAQVQIRQDLRDLVRDVGRLPDDQRAALVLAELESLSHGEIAEVLQVPAPKVKALIFQARQSLLAARRAREIDCHEIRELLASVRGAALRRGHLRRHLTDCPGCRDYRTAVEQQRHRLALVLPVAPTLALKDAVIAGTVGGGAAGTGLAGGGLLAAGSALKGLSAAGVLAAVAAGLGTAGTFVALHAVPRHHRAPARHAAASHVARPPRRPVLAATVPVPVGAEHRSRSPVAAVAATPAPTVTRRAAVRLAWVPRAEPVGAGAPPPPRAVRVRVHAVDAVRPAQTRVRPHERAAAPAPPPATVARRATAASPAMTEPAPAAPSSGDEQDHAVPAMRDPGNSGGQGNGQGDRQGDGQGDGQGNGGHGD